MASLAEPNEAHMTTHAPATRDARTSSIPITRLSVHEGNVCRTDKRADIEALAASIETHGLLQNLTVVAREDGRYAVTAGGRRLAALKLLARQGRIARDYAAACLIVPNETATETSLAENIQRVAMNVMDEVEAFERLTADGRAAGDIARRFGTTVRHVEQRLALARLSPKIKAAYRRAELTLDVARAFCLSDDHGAQEVVLRSMAKPITHASSVRSALTRERLPAHDRLARFVGLDAYEQAGGRISRDLFEDHVVFLDDADLVRQLADDKTEALRDGFIAQGWGWAEVNLGHASTDRCAGERLRPTRKTLSAAEQAEINALQVQCDALDKALSNAADDDARWSERDALETRLTHRDEQAMEWNPALMKHAGVAIAIGPDGTPTITPGLIRRADLKTFSKARRSLEAHVETDAPATRDEEIGADMPAELRLPKGVTMSLTEARTIALRAALAANPQVALAAMVDVLDRRSRCGERHPAIDIVSTQKRFAAEEDRKTGCDTPMAFSELTTAPVEDLLSRLAALVAETLDVSHAGVTPQDRRLQHDADMLAAALELDMAQLWKPTEDFWRQVPKSVTLSALRAAPTLAALSEPDRTAMFIHLGKLKKAELAAAAAEALEGARWLPDVLVTPPGAGAFIVTPDGEAALGAIAA